MKVQYFGDVNDYRKFALLRLLATEGKFKIGVCWMLTADDEGVNGKNRHYLQQPDVWRGFDPELFDSLKTVLNPPSQADFERVERQGLIPEAIYFEDLTLDTMTERNTILRTSRLFTSVPGEPRRESGDNHRSSPTRDGQAD